MFSLSFIAFLQQVRASEQWEGRSHDASTQGWASLILTFRVVVFRRQPLGRFWVNWPGDCTVLAYTTAHSRLYVPQRQDRRRRCYQRLARSGVLGLAGR